MPLERHSIRIALAATLLVAVYGFPLVGQKTVPAPPPLLIPSMYGGDLFQEYCASCHGRDGTGNGPAADALKRVPPDLTTLAARSGGTFPTLRVARLIGGKDGEPFPPSHGSREMPVWGPIFKALDTSPKGADIRIANLVAHVESIQVK
jgi:hypothetical protein